MRPTTHDAATGLRHLRIRGSGCGGSKGEIVDPTEMDVVVEEADSSLPPGKLPATFAEKQVMMSAMVAGGVRPGAAHGGCLSGPPRKTAAGTHGRGAHSMPSMPSNVPVSADQFVALGRAGADKRRRPRSTRSRSVESADTASSKTVVGP